MKEIIIKKSKIHGMGAFANRDFKKGEEITANYLLDNVPGLNMKCTCGEVNCKKVIKMTKNKNCSCPETSCSRHGNCEKCQEYHHKRGEKTSCGK